MSEKRKNWRLEKEVVFNPEKGEIRWHNQRLIVLSAYELPSIHQEALKIIGPLANTEVYETCAQAVKQFFEGQIKNIEKMSEEELAKNFAEEMTNWGIGRVEIVDLDLKKGGIIRVYDGCYYSYYENPKQPVCFITAGMLKGMLEAITKKSVEVKEEKCMALKEPYCEFRFEIK